MPAYALALAVLVIAPLLAPGYLLLRDAVSTPRSYLSDAALGLSDAAPRALPQDFAVAVVSQVVDGGIVVKALLVAGLWLAGWGCARLAAVVVPDAGMPGQFVAATLAIWNPYVAERLLQGHWSLLVGYGCLPWVAATVLQLRLVGDAPLWPRVCALALWTALAGLTPTGLMLAATVAVVCSVTPGSGRPRGVCAGIALGLAVVAALPWLVAAGVSQSLSSSQAEGVRAFAARAEPGLGTLGSLASLGGIWNGEAVPASRTTLFVVVAAVVLLGVVAVGVPVAMRRPLAVPLLVLAVVAVVVPAAMATAPGLAVVESAVRAFPGIGVVRDGQKWVALAVPGYTVAAAAAVVTLRRWLPAFVTATVCSLALIATLPDLAWGVGGKVVAVHYPPGWAAAAAAINADPRPVAVLPTGSMRHFPWAGDAPVLDPLPRWVRAEVLTTGDLVISGRLVPGEGGRARSVEGLLTAGADPHELARAGVGWLLVQSGDDLSLTRIGGDYPAAAHRGLMLTVHWVWVAMLAGGLAGMVVARARRPVK
ncbi:hypothetical protein CQY20_27470 [Mycolicibacterium agri]|uniref:Membrane protein n=1 Tax=Mycolicibacterium agri TaxID=36811 RepID=A0A2A7MRB8_MYCAG|nr:hypothetical protein [Mycolicibacterium agri]PEG34057.1 hypothetical protein CQY20_27470 [Mycolicibacterium agri]GFG53115.1 membrane protein [Mycolicibacterium agri]